MCGYLPELHCFNIFIQEPYGPAYVSRSCSNLISGASSSNQDKLEKNKRSDSILTNLRKIDDRGKFRILIITVAINFKKAHTRLIDVTKEYMATKTPLSSYNNARLFANI